MRPLSRTRGALLSLAAVTLLAFPANVIADEAQGQVSVYTGDNAVGYLQPLANALGATLNSGFGYSAFVPRSGFHMSLEVPVMGVKFADDDRTFTATTEAGFDPPTSEEVSTVVGPGDAVVVSGTGGAQFAFPGGFDLSSFGLAVPQLRISSVIGLEAIVRWVAFETDDQNADLGEVDVFGIGGRYNVSQHMGEAPPLDVAVGLMYQTMEMGQNEFGNPFVDSSALMIQLQGSKRLPLGFTTLEPYGILAYQGLDADVEYADTNDQPVDVSLEGENTVGFTLGLGWNFVAGEVWADYTFAGMNSFTFGLALGNLGRQQ